MGKTIAAVIIATALAVSGWTYAIARPATVHNVTHTVTRIVREPSATRTIRWKTRTVTVTGTASGNTAPGCDEVNSGDTCVPGILPGLPRGGATATFDGTRLKIQCPPGTYAISGGAMVGDNAVSATLGELVLDDPLGTDGLPNADASATPGPNAPTGWQAASSNSSDQINVWVGCTR
jgi:hypothetical protein